MSSYHISVLPTEAIESLEINEGIYVDATMGGGGHSLEIFKKMKKGILVSIDQDIDSIDYVKKNLWKQEDNKKWIIVKDNFSNIREILNSLDIYEIDSILYDVGVSSYQIDNKERGFSYGKASPLDMRMNKDTKLTAEEILNTYSASDLNKIFKKYGEEPQAKRVTNKILEYRTQKHISNSRELISIIRSCVGMSTGARERVAKRVFQALRVEVNQELSALSLSLTQAFEILKSNGVCSVITFQPLERNIVEAFAQNHLATSKSINIIVPGAKELVNNLRSKSAKMFVIKKI